MVEELKCEYLECKGKSWSRHPLKLTNEENASVELPFCQYHFFIVMGGHFVAKKIEKDKDYTFKIIGPLKEVEIAEQVLAAREVVSTKK